MTKVVLTIAGLDPSGGAGIAADIKTISAFGCFAAAAVSSITFQNTRGVFGASHQTPETVRRQIEPILDDYEVDAVKTGILPTREVIGEVSGIIAARGLKNIVVDPVVRSTSGFDLIDESALRSLIDQLFPLADLITPNIPEAERISGVAIETEEDIRTAAAIIREMGARNVLIKGGHLPILNPKVEISDLKSEISSSKARDFLFLSGELLVLERPYIDTTATHGTGCTLSAAIATNLALGNDLAKAVEIAKAFVNEAIRTAPMLGRGHSPVNIRPI